MLLVNGIFVQLSAQCVPNKSYTGGTD